MSLYFSSLEVRRPPYLGASSWLLKKLNQITVLFGKNGSGKSILLRNLRDADRSVYHYASPERAGDISHDVGIMQAELVAESRASRRTTNVATTYRQEAVSRIQSVLIKLGAITGRSGQPSPIKLDVIEESLDILLPAFEFRIRESNNPPFELRRN